MAALLRANSNKLFIFTIKVAVNSFDAEDKITKRLKEQLQEILTKQEKCLAIITGPTDHDIYEQVRTQLTSLINLRIMTDNKTIIRACSIFNTKIAELLDYDQQRHEANKRNQTNLHFF